MTDARFIRVLERVASMADWKPRPSPAAAASGSARMVKGRGVAMSLRGGTYSGNVAEVEVDRHSGKVRVTTVWGAQDNGLTVNPRAVVLGAEAAIVQTVSRTLLEQVTFSKSAITSLDWVSYPIITFEQAPKLNFEIIDDWAFASTGSGEPPMTPTAAAVGNAIFDATGVRLRSLPFRPEVVKAALHAAGKAL